MTITQKINLDLRRATAASAINAVQGDVYTRLVEITLTDDGEPWQIPRSAKMVVSYLRGDGTGGEYDTLPAGVAAGSFSGNVIQLVLAPQMLTEAGLVQVTLTLIQDADQISTFRFLVNVHPNVGAQIRGWEKYYHVNGFLPMPSVAENGQFLRVSAVDSQGWTRQVEAMDAEDVPLWVPDPRSADLTGVTANASHRTVVLEGPLTVDEGDAFRIRRLAVKATSGAAVRFALFRYRAAQGDMVKVATIGDAVVDSGGMAVWTSEEGYWTTQNDLVIVAMADSASIGCVLTGSGDRVTGLLRFDDGDYHSCQDGTSIPCTMVTAETTRSGDVRCARYAMDSDRMTRMTMGQYLLETGLALAEMDGRVERILPTATVQDNGKILTVSNGEYVLKAPDPVQVEGLPPVTAADNGKILKVADGAWSLGTDNSGGGSEPATTIATMVVGGFEMDADLGLYYSEVYNLSFTLEVGTVYRVTWDGEDYVCRAEDASDFAVSGAVLLGDGTLAGLPGNGEPFAMIYLNGTLMLGIADTNNREFHDLVISRDDIGVMESYIQYHVGRYINEALGGDY